MTTIEQLAEEVRIAKRDVERAKLLYYNREGTYDGMADAARKLSSVMYRYQQAKYPQMRAKRIPYQAILR